MQPSFSNLNEYFHTNRSYGSQTSLTKLKVSPSLGNLGSLASFSLLSPLQRMTPLKSAQATPSSQLSTPQASVTSNTSYFNLQKQSSLTQLNLEFCQPNKKSRPNSPSMSAVNLFTAVERTAPDLPRGTTHRNGNPAFVISPSETPLQTPLQSPPLHARAFDDKGVDSAHLISRLEKQSAQVKDESDQKDDSIAINGTLLPPIRSVFSFPTTGDQLHAVHVKDQR